MKLKVGKRKELTKIRVKINETETKRQQKRSMKLTVGSLKR